MVAIVAVLAVQHPNRYSGAPAAHTSAVNSAPATVHSTAGSRAPATSATSVRSAAAASAAGRTTVAPGPPPAVKLPLVVVNNAGTAGLAATAAHTFETGGWTVTLLANLSQPTSATSAYYDPGVANAKAVAQGLQRQFPAIREVLPRFADLPVGPIVVVLTSDYSG